MKWFQPYLLEVEGIIMIHLKNPTACDMWAQDSPGLEKSKLQRGVQLSAAEFPKTIVLSHTGCGRIHEAAANTDEPLHKLHWPQRTSNATQRK